MKQNEFMHNISKGLKKVEKEEAKNRTFSEFVPPPPLNKEAVREEFEKEL